ncbi:MAG: efflux RND transporter periplasmic adaptor subunit, partial [Bacteroidales bacterium]|nr:efflux RND transporter periplasmic adaptor subunit [Bacteroidales bacterium]
LAGIEFGKIEKRLLSGDVDARGKLLLPQNGKATISPIIRGVISSIEVMPGQAVQKGQVLAYLTHPDYVEIQEQYLNTINSLEYLENEYNRQKRLYDENVGSEKKFLLAKTEFQAAKAKLTALKLMIEQIGIDPKEIEGGKIFSKIPVKTPITGMVDMIMANLGKNVAEGDALFEITCRKKLFIELEVFEKDIMKIRKGQRVSFSLANVENRMYEAKVISIGGSVQRAGRVVKVLAEFENTNEFLFPGMFVASQIHTGEEVLEALPAGAIMNYGSGNPYIYFTVEQEGNKNFFFSKIAVKTGFEEDEFVQIEAVDAIPQNARIVTKGGYYIQAEEGKGE